MGDIGDAWEQVREESQKRKHKKQKWNSDVVYFLAAEYDFKVETIQEYHLRLILNEKKLDYFPQTGRATWLGINKWFEIRDIEKWLIDLLNADK